MTAHHAPSVEELRRESERSRAALASTVVELRAKVSDTAEGLKTRVSPVQIFHSIERKARENPLQAVAIGAGLAYPLWGLLRTIPGPLMLVGAGLWLASQKPRLAGDSSISAIGAKVADLGAQGASQIAESVRGAGAAVTAGVGNVADKVKAAAHDVRSSVEEMGQAVVGSVADNATTAKNLVSEAASNVSNKAAEVGEQSRNAFVDMVHRNPLLVAGVGLGIGAFIAASLPASDTENRMFGERSDDLKDKAREAASLGVVRAKDVAAGMVGEVAASAAREGLSAEGLGRAVEGLTEGVKSVVDRGMKTALGGKESPQPPNSTHPNKS